MEIRIAYRDRRKWPRKLLRKRVKFGYPTPSHFGYTLNFSKGGLGIKANRVYQPGSKLLIFVYHDGMVAKTEGIVKWVSPTLPGMASSMGVELTSKIEVEEENKE